ncbi:MAG: hypothetical protein OXR73_17715 [Myxococcales bacterium]|nr:hypothetical protein [Myxococcales bacterium]
MRPDARTRWLAGGTLAVVATMASVAAAHGASPGVIDVASMDDGGHPRVARITEGLIQQRGDSWQYVCPIQFGRELSPLARSPGGERTLVVGTAGLFILEPDGTVTPAGPPELSRATVLSLVALGDSLLALNFAEGASQLLRLDLDDLPDAMEDLPVIWEANGLYQSLSAGPDHVWVAGMMETTAVAVKLAADGTKLDERSFTTETTGSVIHVASISTGTFASIIARDGKRLVRLSSDASERSTTVVLESKSPVFGPIVSPSGPTWVAAQGRLYRLNGTQTVEVETGAITTGLVSHGATDFLLAGLRTHHLDADGPGATLIDLAQLQGPQLRAVRMDLRDRCQAEWARARLDIEEAIARADEAESVAASAEGSDSDERETASDPQQPSSDLQEPDPDSQASDREPNAVEEEGDRPSDEAISDSETDELDEGEPSASAEADERSAAGGRDGGKEHPRSSTGTGRSDDADEEDRRRSDDPDDVDQATDGGRPDDASSSRGRAQPESHASGCTLGSSTRGHTGDARFTGSLWLLLVLSARARRFRARRRA